MATVDIRDQATAALRALPAGMAPAHMNQAIGAAEVGLFQKWLLGMPANAMGWPSTGFYQDAARSTHFDAGLESVMVSISKQGMRQRYEGGEIHQKPGGPMLTIPARPEAYGHRAGDIGRPLRFAVIDGHPALVGMGAVASLLGTRASGKNKGKSKAIGEKVETVVFYWLARSVNQSPNHGVLPPDDLIANTAMETIEDAVDRALKRTT